MVIGVAPSLEISPAQLLGTVSQLRDGTWHLYRFGRYARIFSLTGVRSMNEVFPLERVAEAYERMLSGKATFRAVLSMEQ